MGNINKFERSSVTDYNRAVAEHIIKQEGFKISVYDMNTRYVRFQQAVPDEVNDELALWLFKALTELVMFRTYDVQVNTFNNTPRLLLTELERSHPGTELSMDVAMMLDKRYRTDNLICGICDTEDHMAAVHIWEEPVPGKLCMSKVYL